MKLKKFIATTISEYLNENKYDDNLVYHGGDISDGIFGNAIFVTKDKKQAELYANAHHHNINSKNIVTTFKIDINNIVSEDYAREILYKFNFKSKEDGWNLNELSFHEIVDENFTTSLSKNDIKKYISILKSNGATGVEFSDIDITTNRCCIQNLYIIDLNILKEINQKDYKK